MLFNESPMKKPTTKKLFALHRNKNPTALTFPPLHVVHNSSVVALDQITENIFTKGFNFFITPMSILTETIIPQVETAISHLPENKAEEIRQDISSIFITAKSPLSNITASIRRSVNNLNNLRKMLPHTFKRNQNLSSTTQSSCRNKEIHDSQRKVPSHFPNLRASQDTQIGSLQIILHYL